MKSHYPQFDVLDSSEEWDEHTRSIVLQRLETPSPLKFLSATESVQLSSIFEVLLDEARPEIIEFVVGWYDSQLASDIGEGDREDANPPEAELVRSGLRALEVATHVTFGKSVSEVAKEVLVTLLADLQQGRIDAGMKWSTKLQQALFKKIHVSATKAYYSHPTIWSEIGYAGPAYPRGYVRSEFGLTDPWEARRDV